MNRLMKEILGGIAALLLVPGFTASCSSPEEGFGSHGTPDGSSPAESESTLVGLSDGGLGDGSAGDGAWSDGASVDGSLADGSLSDFTSVESSTEDSSSEDDSSPEGSSSDDRSPDDSPVDSVPTSPDSSPADSSLPDNSPADGSLPDSSPPDGSPADGHAADSSPADGHAVDGSPADGHAVDGNPADTSVPDTSVPDTSVPDTSVPDTSVPDTSVPDTSVPDTSVPDTSVPDASQADSSPADSSMDSGSGVACTWDSTVRDGTFTEYYFSQGESQANGYYETACGYYGTETTTNSWSSVDQVLNIANSGAAKNTYFAAIPSDTSGVWPTNDCGACIEFIGSNGTKVIATIIDECPTNGGMNPHCTEANHLDLSTSLFGATMVPAGQSNTGGDPSGGSWKFIACPITTDIVVHFNNGYTGDIYIENMVFPVQSATANGYAMTQSTYGYWSASGVNDLRGATLVLTDTEGHTVTGTVPSADNTTGASIGVQFPSPGTCSL
jgi:expansin